MLKGLGFGIVRDLLICMKCTKAGWQSGHAADCNSVNAGSIPTPASILTKEPSKTISSKCPDGEIGRRKGLKIPRLKDRAGSIPAPGTIS